MTYNPIAAMNPVSTDELYCLLVPLATERLIVPRACVAEVANWQEPEKVPNAPLWYLGTMKWHDQTVPVISFEATCGNAIPLAGGRTRVLVVVAAEGQLAAGHFGIMTQGFPQLVRVNSDIIKPDPTTSFVDPSTILCRVRMVNETPLVPDLSRLELMISEETRA